MKSFLTRSAWSRVDKWLAILVLSVLAVFVLSDQIGRIEGRLFPVVIDYTAEVEQTSEDGKITISGSFYLARANCSFQQVEWYLDTQNGEVPVGVQYGRGVQLDPGLNTFSGLNVDIAPDRVHDLVGIASYQCPFRPWITRTQFFP